MDSVEYWFFVIWTLVVAMVCGTMGYRAGRRAERGEDDPWNEDADAHYYDRDPEDRRGDD